MKHFLIVATILLSLSYSPVYARGGHSSHFGHSSSHSGHVNSHSTVVHGYYRKNGTYVHSYHRTTPNSTKLDNYSTRGNVNPWTGKAGTIDPNK